MDNLFVIDGASIFTENAIVLANKFKIKLITDFKPKAKDIYIAFGSHDIAMKLLEAQKKTGCVYIIMNSEQMGSPVLKTNYIFNS